ncbi:MAG: hypothetical protein IGS23_06275 [Rivularia sp. T60_A2020_040]|nr:hypothetical protein [Rivularia sp. T60_A2020_040]
MNIFIEANGRKYEMRGLTCMSIFSHLLATGEDKMNFRSWTTSYRGYVLFHSSASDIEDCIFEDYDIPIEDSPKSSILGYGVLFDVVKLDTKELFEAYYDDHKCATYEYEEISQNYNGKLYGHRFKDAVIFPPIVGVPGSRNYWTPKKEVQVEAFKLVKKFHNTGVWESNV